MSMFKSAKTIEPSKPSKKTAENVQIDGLKDLAEVDALIKSLGAIREQLDQDVKAAGFDHFYDVANGRRPDNFKGIDGDATASIELRKRSTASGLTEDEIALLVKHNLPYEKAVATPRMFGINPKYAENEELLGKVETALKSIVPEDFIVLQEEKSKQVVVDDTLEQAFKISAPREVIETITVMAVKPKLTNFDLNVAIENVKKLLGA